MNSKTHKKPTTFPTSSQTNEAVSPFNARSIKAAIFETLALKVGNEIKTGTIAPSTRRAFFRNLVFHLSSTFKKDPI